jgi:hypothetical protein
MLWHKHYAEVCAEVCVTMSSQQEVQTTLTEVVRDNSSAGALDESVAAYVSGLATHLINARDFASDTWTNKVASHFCAASMLQVLTRAKS